MLARRVEGRPEVKIGCKKNCLIKHMKITCFQPYRAIIGVKIRRREHPQLPPEARSS